MTTTMTQRQIYFKEHQFAALLKLSEKTGAPVAELVRRAVDAYLKKQKEV